MSEKNPQKLYSKEDLSKIASAGATRGVGGAVRKAASIKYYDKLDRAAQKTSNIIRRKRRPKKSTETPLNIKKMVGWKFYSVFTIILIEEILDIFLDATGFLALVTILTSVFVTFIVFIYLYLENVSMDSKKLATWIISFCVEFIPVINFFPTYLLSFVLTRVIENNSTLKTKASFTKNKIIRSRR
jgi:hypothetical protein